MKKKIRNPNTYIKWLISSETEKIRIKNGKDYAPLFAAHF